MVSHLAVGSSASATPATLVHGRRRCQLGASCEAVESPEPVGMVGSGLQPRLGASSPEAMEIKNQPCFLDASALVKMLLRESGSTRLADFLRGKEPYYTTSLCFGEGLGVLERK